MNRVPFNGSLWDVSIFKKMGLRGRMVVILSNVWYWLQGVIETHAEKCITAYSPARAYTEQKMQEIEKGLSSKAYFPFIDPGADAIYQKGYFTKEERYKTGRQNADSPAKIPGSVQSEDPRYSQLLATQLSSARSRRYSKGRNNFTLNEQFEPMAKEVTNE